MTTPAAPCGADLHIPNDPAWIETALDYIEAMAKAVGFEPEEGNKIRLATEEVVEFLMQVGSEDPCAPPVTVHITPRPHEFQISIATKGMPFDIQKLPTFDPDGDPEISALDGLGLHLARWALDRIVFHNLGRDGIQAELTKRNRKARVQEMVETQSMESPANTVPQVHVDDFSIRPLDPAEALEVSRCAYLTYGHSYESFIYYPEHIVEMNRDGQLHSQVAVAPSGEIMGHCGLKCSPKTPDRTELGVLFVRPKYRRNNVGGKLWAAAVQLARQEGFVSVMARSVTGHKASQRLAEENGFHDCCLFLALCPPDVELKSIGGTQQGKMSLMMQWLALKPPRSRAIHPPTRYAGVLKELYRQAGIPTQKAESPHPRSDAPILHFDRMPDLNIGILEVEDLGSTPATVTNWVLQSTRHLCRDKLDTIYLFLNLEQPGTDEIADACSEAGFIFAGISPDGFPQGDALVLQYLNLSDDPFSGLDVLTDTSRMLRDFIYEEWVSQEN